MAKRFKREAISQLTVMTKSRLRYQKSVNQTECHVCHCAVRVGSRFYRFNDDTIEHAECAHIVLDVDEETKPNTVLVATLKFIHAPTRTRPCTGVTTSITFTRDLSTRDLKKLWDIEHLLNELPSDTRVHVSIDEAPKES